jgi:outer membrane immunogenic protein
MITRIQAWAVVSACFGAISTAAVAADMPVKAPPVAAVAAPSWTGFYLKGGAGYGEWAADTTTITTAAGDCFVCLPIRQGGRGWFGTVGGGFDYQANSNIVIGVFADYDFGSIKGTIQDQNQASIVRTKLDWSWSVGARAGWLITPSFLAYINGGYTRAHFTGGNGIFVLNGAPALVSYREVTTGGWFLGGGAETMIMPGWFWRNEYRLAHYDVRDFVACLNNGAGCGPVVAGDTIRFRPYVQTVRSEVAYKFNWGGPAVAPAPRPAPVATWTGFYLNGGAGYGMWAADTTTHDDFNGFVCRVCVPIRQGGRGGFATVGGGFDYQATPSIVVGAFAEYDFASIKGSIVGDIGAPQPRFTAQTRLDRAWYVGGRAGWVVAPAVLTYVNGGYTEARFTGNRILDSFNGAPNFVDTTYRNLTVSGWFLGGGGEAQMWQSWFWRSEYRYARYNDGNFVPCRVDGGGCGVVATAMNTVRFQPTVQTFRSEVVYKFNWGSPVVARF